MDEKTKLKISLTALRKKFNRLTNEIHFLLWLEQAIRSQPLQAYGITAEFRDNILQWVTGIRGQKEDGRRITGEKIKFLEEKIRQIEVEQVAR